MKIFVLAFLLAVGCGGCGTEKKKEEKKADLSELLPIIEERKAFYLAQSLQKKDGYGWDINSKCDGLLFNSLWAVAGAPINIEMARDSSGKWYRHASQSCYKEGGATSEISRDMILGLLLYIWEYKRLDIIQALIKYGEAHNWRMGEGDKTKTGIRVNLKATIFELQYRLGGGDSLHRAWPQAWDKPVPFSLAAMKPGYETHLQILHIYIRGLITERISVREYDLLKHYTNREPRNALYSAVFHLFTDSNMLGPVNLLLDTSLFPASHLPTNLQYCTEYLFQRDQYSDSWRSCPIQKSHTGIDWLFAFSVIMKGV